MKSFAKGLLLGLSIIALAGAVWNAGWEARPAGTDQASDLDLFIQEFKAEVADRIGVESLFGNASLDNGLHRVGSARVFSQDAAPTAITGPGQYNSTAAAFSGTALTTTEVVGGTDDIGRGRLWVDEDGAVTGTVATEPAATGDMQLSVWDETLNGFRRVVARDQGGAGVGASNLIRNGSFEATDGTGSTASISVPIGWALVLTPTLAYVSVANSTEGDGLALTTIGSGAALEGVSQTLAGLKELTTYVYRARVSPNSGTCRLLVDDGASNASATSAAASGVFETLEVLHTTTAAPADVVVSLLSVADTDDCDWTHVAAFERYAVVPMPGNRYSFDSDSAAAVALPAGYGLGANPLLTAAITAPGPGYTIISTAAVSTALGNLVAAEYELTEQCGAGAETARFITGEVAGGAAGNNIANTSLQFLNRAPVPGETCTYRIRGLASAGAPSYTPAGTQSNLIVQIVPVR